MKASLNILRAKKRVSIGIRLAIMMAVLLVLSTGSFAVFSLMSQRREAMDMFAQSSRNMSRSLERILRFSMLENRRDETELAIKEIAKEEDIKSVTLVTHRGEPVYSSSPTTGELVSIEDARCASCHANAGTAPLRLLPAKEAFRILKDRKVARVSLPVYNAPECYTAACHAHSQNETVLGVMQMDVSFARIDEMLKKSYARIMAFSIVIALVTSLIVLALIHRWVSHPVQSLLNGTRLVAEGELGHIIPVGEAEMGALARSFNKMQEKLLSSQRQLIMSEKFASIGKLSASVAHEINNPLTGILTFAEDLMDNSDPNDPKLADYKVIHREAIRCREIVRELMDFSRPNSPNMQLVDMNEILSHTIKFISKQATFRNVELRTNLQKNLPLVVADSTQLQQVILGILINASEAMPEGGKILITSSSPAGGAEVRISMRDTGIGISEGNIQHVFEPFFSTKGGKSMGIGLAVSWNIINQHGGRLEVESKQGEGAMFRIVIPSKKTAPIVADMPV